MARRRGRRLTPGSFQPIPDLLVELVHRHAEGVTLRQLVALIWPDLAWAGKGSATAPRDGVPPAAALRRQLDALVQQGQIGTGPPVPEVDTLAGLFYRPLGPVRLPPGQGARRRPDDGEGDRRRVPMVPGGKARRRTALADPRLLFAAGLGFSGCDIGAVLASPWLLAVLLGLVLVDLILVGVLLSKGGWKR